MIIYSIVIVSFFQPTTSEDIMNIIPGFDADKLQEAAQKALNAFLGLDPKTFNPNPKGRSGGFLAVTTRFSDHLFLCIPVGKLQTGLKVESSIQYGKNAVVVKPRMLRYNHTIVASSQVESADHGHWGGAIAIEVPAEFHELILLLGSFKEKVREQLVFSFSGLPPEGDEGVVICVAYLLKLITLEQAREMSGKLNNETAFAMISVLVKDGF